MAESCVDRDGQAEEFLRLHGWSQDPENPFNPLAWGHPAFPLSEDMAAHGGAARFCEEFYKEAWGAYSALMRATIVISTSEQSNDDDESEEEERA